MKGKILILTVFTAVMCWMISPSPGAPPKKKKPGGESASLARVTFTDIAGITDRITNDGLSVICGDGGTTDYADENDSCGGEKIKSDISPGGRWLFNTVPGTIGVDRSVVLDFSDQGPGAFTCAELDVDGLGDIAGLDGSVSADPCVFFLQVSMGADRAFKDGATAQMLEIQIRGPGNSPGVWHPRYTLEFINPLSILQLDTDNDGIVDTSILQTATDARAELIKHTGSGKKNKVTRGIYTMPFSLTLKKVRAP